MRKRERERERVYTENSLLLLTAAYCWITHVYLLSKYISAVDLFLIPGFYNICVVNGLLCILCRLRNTALFCFYQHNVHITIKKHKLLTLYLDPGSCVGASEQAQWVRLSASVGGRAPCFSLIVTASSRSAPASPTYQLVKEWRKSLLSEHGVPRHGNRTLPWGERSVCMLIAAGQRGMNQAIVCKLHWGIIHPLFFCFHKDTHKKVSPCKLWMLIRPMAQSAYTAVISDVERAWSKWKCPCLTILVVTTVVQRFGVSRKRSSNDQLKTWLQSWVPGMIARDQLLEVLFLGT